MCAFHDGKRLGMALIPSPLSFMLSQEAENLVCAEGSVEMGSFGQWLLGVFYSFIYKVQMENLSEID